MILFEGKAATILFAGRAAMILLEGRAAIEERRTPRPYGHRLLKQARTQPVIPSGAPKGA
jgi:hypothetical protein